MISSSEVITFVEIEGDGRGRGSLAVGEEQTVLLAAEARVAECLGLEGQSTDSEEEARHDEDAEDSDEGVPFEKQSKAGRRRKAAAATVVFVC